jgi:Leucine-rich repeat (LRR) protein
LIKRIDCETFTGLANVSVIDLARNLLAKITQFTFNQTRKLSQLDLSNNLISIITLNAFSGLQSSMSVLNLSFNKLEFIKKYYFKNLTVLSVLDLQMNQLSSIEQGTFNDLHILAVLDLNNNCLFHIQNDLFKNIKKIKLLDLSFNLIKKVHPECLKTQLELTNLSLSANDIENFNSVHLPKLAFVDLSHNKILKTVNITNQTISINLNSAAMVQFVMKTALRNIKNLFASSINPKAVRNLDFKMLPSLVELDLGCNDLSYFTSFFDYKNINLKKLLLQGSILNSDLAFLNNHVNLVELDLTSALSVKWLGQQIFGKFTKLEVLKLGNLSLNYSYLDKFIKIAVFTKLVYLDLSRNNLEYFTINFKQHSVLKTILLNNNKLKAFDLSLLPEALLYLDLSSNNLSIIEKPSTKQMIQTVLLNNNCISWLSTLLVESIARAV